MGDSNGLEQLVAASVDLPEIDVDDGVDVIIEGQPQARLLVLVSGAVEVRREGIVVSTIAEPGAVFGEVSALLRGPATASVRTRGQCTFRICDNPEEFLSERPGVALAIATVLARRLDALTRYLVDIKEQYADTDGQLGMVDVVLESLSHHQGRPPEPGSDREREAPY